MSIINQQMQDWDHQRVFLQFVQHHSQNVHFINPSIWFYFEFHWVFNVTYFFIALILPHMSLKTYFCTMPTITSFLLQNSCDLFSEFPQQDDVLHVECCVRLTMTFSSLWMQAGSTDAWSLRSYKDESLRAFVMRL